MLLDSFEPGTRSVVKSLCQGRKRCVALMMASEAGPREPELEVGASPEPELAFSHQVAWVLASPSSSGHIVTLSCSGRSHTWLSRDDGKMSVDSVVMIRRYLGLDNVDFDKTMFDVCHKPTPGTDMTFAYFHLKPYVFVSGNGAVTAGIEVKLFRVSI